MPLFSDATFIAAGHEAQADQARRILHGWLSGAERDVDLADVLEVVYRHVPDTPRPTPRSYSAREGAMMYARRVVAAVVYGRDVPQPSPAEARGALPPEAVGELAGLAHRAVDRRMAGFRSAVQIYDAENASAAWARTEMSGPQRPSALESIFG